jgi:hypothetical protein
MAEASAGQRGARGDPFIGARGEGNDGARRTPVRTRPHGGAMPCKDAATAARTRQCQLPCAARGWARGRGEGGDGGRR